MNGLLAATARAVRRPAVMIGPVLGLVLVGASSSALDRSGTSAAVLRGVALLLAASVVVALDDAAAEVLAASPTSLARRVLARVGAVLGICALVWTAAVAWVAVHGTVAVWGLTLELLATVAVGVAAARVVATRGRPEPAALVVPALVLALLGAAQLPARWAMLVAPGATSAWVDAHLRWTGVLSLALAVVVVSLRDPAQRRRPAPSRGPAFWRSWISRRRARA